MKKLTRIALIALTVLIALSLFSCGKKDDGVPAGMKRASDEMADFTLYVPEEWNVDMATAAVGAYYSASDPSSVSVMAWGLEYADANLDDWWEINLSEIEKVFTNVEIISEDNLDVDGLYAKRYVYSASLGDYDYTIMQAACLKRGAVYLFTYESIPENYDAHLTEVDEMLANLKIGR